MSREEIIKMAREANARWEHGDWNMPSAVVFDNEKDLERFFHMAQAAEREACARRAEIALLGGAKIISDHVLKAIRAER